jgi:hypothetical protein
MAYDTDTHERTYCATTGIAVTPSDSADLSIGFTRRVIVSVAGDLSVVFRNDDTMVIPSACIVAGVPLDIAVKRINATGTTATGIIAFK